MLPPRFQTEGSVKSGNAVNVHQGSTGLLGDYSQLIFRKVSIPCLDTFQEVNDAYVITVGFLYRISTSGFMPSLPLACSISAI